MEQIKNPIYLEDYNLAQKMYEAGFPQDCLHTLYRYYNEEPSFDRYQVLAYGHSIQDNIRIPNTTNYAIDLALPTLGEIELPKNIVLVKLADVWVVYDVLSAYEKVILDLGIFPTELEARCHAWLWANKKEEQNG